MISQCFGYFHQIGEQKSWFRWGFPIFLLAENDHFDHHTKFHNFRDIWLGRMGIIKMGIEKMVIEVDVLNTFAVDKSEELQLK